MVQTDLKLKITADAGASVEAVNRLNGALGKLAHYGVGLGLVLPNLAALVSSVAQSADAFANLSARIRIASDGLGSAVAAQAGLFEVAQRTRQPLEAVADAYGKLSSAGKELGLSQQDVIRTTETLSKALALGGGSAQGQQAALLQLGQALGAGALRGDEFNSVVEQAPGLIKVLADALGVPTGALRGMAEQGRLTTELIIGALAGSADKVDAAFSRLPATVGGALTQLGNSFLQTLGLLDQAGGVSEKAAAGIKTLADNMGAALTAAGLLAGGLATLRLSNTASTVATGALRAGLGLLGGPLGVLATALGLGATAWLAWKGSAVGSEQAVETQVAESHEQIVARINKQIAALKERNALAGKTPETPPDGNVQQAGAAFAELESKRQRVQAGTGEFAGVPAAAREELNRLIAIQAAEAFKAYVGSAELAAERSAQAGDKLVADAAKTVALDIDIKRKWVADAADIALKYNEAIAKASGDPAEMASLERERDQRLVEGQRLTDEKLAAAAKARGAVADAALKARLDADKAAREAQATLAADANARELAALQRRLEAETLSLDGFHAEKLRLARADVGAQIRLREQELATLGKVSPKDDAEAQQQRAERSRLQTELTKLRRDQAQLPADTERERQAATLKVAEQTLREQLVITQRGIDAELALRTQARAAGELDAAGLAAATEQAALRRVQAEVTAAEAILAERRRLGAPAAEVRAAEADAGAARGRRTEQRTGTLADAGEQIRRLREQARDIRLSLVLDPQQRDLEETEARIKRLRDEAGSITARLQVQLDAQDTTEDQRAALKAQIGALARATADAVTAENAGLAERLKPGWQRMVDGWRDTQRLMREATDNAMQGILSSGEDAFVRFAQTGKLSVRGMVDTIIAELARVQFRQAVAGSTGQRLIGLIASFLPGAGGSSAGAGSGGVDYSLPTAGVRLGKTAGGLVTGPGSGTSDDIPAMLSNGEFVIRAAAVQRLGLGLLERLNQADRVPVSLRRNLPAFAAGGLVGASAAAAGQPGAAPTVQVVVNNTAPGTQASARESRGPDGRGIVNVLVEQVEAVMAGNVTRGAGPMAGALQRTYGLNRAAGAY